VEVAPWTMAPLLLILAQALVTGASSSASFCPVEGADYYDQPNHKTIKEFFECPGAEDPEDHTICCEQKCCPLRHIDSVMKVDIRVAMAISLTVIILSVSTGITLIVCCFCSSCPLYDTCAGGYTRASPRPFDFHGSDTDPLTGKHDPRFYTTADPTEVKIKVTEAEHV